MHERIQRTSEGLSLIDTIVDPRSIVEHFPAIVTEYCQLPTEIDKNTEATGLKRRWEGLQNKAPEEASSDLEKLILEAKRDADRAVQGLYKDGAREADGILIDGYRQAIRCHTITLGQVDQLKLGEEDRRFARMALLEQISFLFYQIGNMSEGIDSNRAHMQCAISCIYSDLELGARETCKTRGWHELSLVTRGFSLLGEGGQLLARVLSGRETTLPEDWWNERRIQNLRQILSIQ
jgi:hypothetical protein